MQISNEKTVMNNHFIHHNLNSKEDILSWKSFLAHYSLESIHQQFENYKAECHLDCINFSRIETSVESLFEINFKGHKFSPNFKYTIEPENRHPNFPYYFFRIRKLPKESWIDTYSQKFNFETMKFKEIQTLQDIWERPAEQVNYYQRLNNPYHSVLYTSLMPSTTILETRQKEKERFRTPKLRFSKKHTGMFRFCWIPILHDYGEKRHPKQFVSISRWFLEYSFE